MCFIMNLVPLILVQRCIMTIQLYNFLSGNLIDKSIQISNGPVFEWLGLWLKPDHLKTRPFEIRTSNVSGFKMVGFRDPHSSIFLFSEFDAGLLRRVVYP